MCGIAGLNGVPERYRPALVASLGAGIDTRGGDAAGYVSVNGVIRYGRTLGEWSDARQRFHYAAYSGDTTMMHARFKTCGTGAIEEAHPFAVKRSGKTILYGAHNGMIYDAQASAKKHDRMFSVDSLELFELMADDEDFSSLHGYGVITWIKPEERDVIHMARLTTSSDLVVASIVEGGFVYASTKKILEEALFEAKLTIDTYYDIKVGVEHTLTPKRFLIWKKERKLASPFWFGTDDDDERDYSPRKTVHSGYGGHYTKCDKCGRWEYPSHACPGVIMAHAACSKCGEIDITGFGEMNQPVWHMKKGIRCTGVWLAPLTNFALCPKCKLYVNTQEHSCITDDTEQCQVCGEESDEVKDDLCEVCRDKVVDHILAEDAEADGQAENIEDTEERMLDELEKEWDTTDWRKVLNPRVS